MKLFDFLYNPFKPHIISVGDCEDEFYIRKLSVTGWGYLDNEIKILDDFFWSSENKFCYARFTELDCAKSRLTLYQVDQILRKSQSKHDKIKRIRWADNDLV